MLQAVLKILTAQKGKTALGLFGILLSSLGVLTILALSLGFKESMQAYYRQLDGLYILKKGAIDPVFSALPAALEEELLAVEGVSAVSPELWDLVSTLDDAKSFSRGLFAFISLGGVDPLKLEQLAGGGIYIKSLEEGLPLAAEDRTGALISRSLAKAYQKSLGDTLLVDGVPFSVRGIYRTGSYFLDSAVLIHQEKAYEILGKSRKFVSAFYLPAAEGEDDILVRRIEAALPKVTVRKNALLGEDFHGIMRTVNIFTYSIAFFAVFFTLVITLNLMAASIRERKRDFGIMLCEGWLPGDLARLVMLEAGILAFSGTLLGILCFGILFQALGWLLPFPPYCSARLIFICLVAGTGAGLLGGLFPLMSLRKLNPAAILRNL